MTSCVDFLRFCLEYPSSEKLIKAYDYIRVEAICNYTRVPIDGEEYTDRDYINVLIGSWKTKEMKNKLETFEQNCLKKSIIMDNDSDINKNKVIRIDNNKSDEFNEIISDFLKELSKQLIIKKVDIKYSD